MAKTKEPIVFRDALNLSHAQGCAPSSELAKQLEFNSEERSKLDQCGPHYRRWVHDRIQLFIKANELTLAPAH